MSLQDMLEPAERPSGSETAQASAPAKAPFKSWRKKYRKIRVRFEEAMRENNTLFKDEHLLLAKARRLQERNDQLLELLVDMNASKSLPSNFRYELEPSTPSASDVPALEPDASPSNRLDSKTKDTVDSGQQPPSNPKSLKSLWEQVPHTVSAPDNLLPPDMMGDLPGYFTPDHEEEYLANIDVVISNGFSSQFTPLIRAAANSVIPSEKEHNLRNPNSVVNWLRRNQPNVFLQDKDLENGGSEKSSAKATAPQRGKRASLNATAHAAFRAGEDMLDDELGFVPEGASAGGRNKKNKWEDDGAYRPPRGGGRGGKRKREDGGEKADKPSKRKYVRQNPSTGAASGGA